MTVPEGWDLRTLEDLAYYYNGRAFKPVEWSDSGLPIIRIAQMRDPDAEHDYYAGDDLDERHQIDDGDLLFSWSATLAVMKWNRGPAAVNQHLFKVIEKPDVDRDYLRYQIEHAIEPLADQSHGSTMKHIKRSVIKTYNVAVPPLPEQRKIAAILSSVDDAIAATEAVIEQTRKVKQGLLQELLTKGIGHTRFKQTEIGEVPEEWELVALRDLASLITSGSRGWSRYYADEGAAFIRSQNVRNGELDLGELVMVNPPEASEGTRTALVPRDVVVSVTGEVGNAALVEDHHLPAYVSQHVALVRLTMPWIAGFIAHYLSPDGPGGAQLRSAEYGQTRPGLNLTDVRSVRVPIPGRDEVSRIEDAIRKVLTVTRSLSAALEAQRTVKAGLLQDLLTGKVRVTP